MRLLFTNVIKWVKGKRFPRTPEPASDMVRGTVGGWTILLIAQACFNAYLGINAKTHTVVILQGLYRSLCMPQMYIPGIIQPAMQGEMRTFPLFCILRLFLFSLIVRKI